MNREPFYKVPRLESKDYTRWVRTLPCANCDRGGGCHAHHRIGHGRCATVKVDDFETMPLCHTCHGLLHNEGWLTWEPANQFQSAMTLQTLDQAVRQGVLVACSDYDQSVPGYLTALRSGVLRLDKKTARGISA